MFVLSIRIAHKKLLVLTYFMFGKYRKYLAYPKAVC